MSQAYNGHRPGEYGGPMFLTPWLSIGPYMTEMGVHCVGVVLPLGASMSSKRHRNNTEGPSTAFETFSNHWATRILGISANHQLC